MKILTAKRNKSYVSPVDLFQAAFDKANPKSASQQAEIKKYRRIKALRDKAKKEQQPAN
jgi:hypothetical protein